MLKNGVKVWRFGIKNWWSSITAQGWYNLGAKKRYGRYVRKMGRKIKQMLARIKGNMSKKNYIGGNVLGLLKLVREGE